MAFAIDGCMSTQTRTVILTAVDANRSAAEVVDTAARIAAMPGAREMTKLERVLLGSVVEPATRRAQCPVYVVRKKDYHSHDVREIAPPCPDCLAVQRSTGGKELWCVHHRERHVHGDMPNQP